MWPEGIQHAFDLPWNFVKAFQMASTIISWQDNMTEEDMPPRSIWHDGEKLDAHFDKVKRKWSGKGDDEYEEGTLADAEAGRSVTLRNKLADYARVSQKLDLDDFSEI